MTEEQVRDQEGLLKAYRQAVEDLKTLRDEHKALSDEKEALQAKVENFKEDAYKPKALTAEMKLALREQGIKDANRLLPYIGTDGIDFDDEGNLVGLDDRLKSLKKDLPEVFDPKVRAGGKADGFATNVVEPKPDPVRDAVRTALHG